MRIYKYMHACTHASTHTHTINKPDDGCAVAVSLISVSFASSLLPKTTSTVSYKVMWQRHRDDKQEALFHMSTLL